MVLSLCNWTLGDVVSSGLLPLSIYQSKNSLLGAETGRINAVTSPNALLILLLLLLLPVAAQAEVVIQAAGDIMLGGRWEQLVAQDGYFHSFAKIAPELKKGDITLVNLEAPLTSRGTEFVDKKYRFRVKPQAAAALKKAGITTVTLANNHSMDYGAEGLADTLRHLSQAGIGHVWAGENLSAARRQVIYDIR